MPTAGTAEVREKVLRELPVGPQKNSTTQPVGEATAPVGRPALRDGYWLASLIVGMPLRWLLAGETALADRTALAGEVVLAGRAAGTGKPALADRTALSCAGGSPADTEAWIVAVLEADAEGY